MQKIISLSSTFIIIIIHFFLTSGLYLYAEIIPIPKQIIPREGNFTFGETLNISFLNDNENTTLSAATMVNRTLAAYLNVKTAIQFEPIKSQLLLVILDEEKAKEQMARFSIPADKKEEAYILGIFPDKIVIEGFHAKGVFYGAVTLSQLIIEAKGNVLAQQYIIDYPDLTVRGISEDISQGQILSVENFKNMLDHLAWYKLNTVFLYIEDAFSFDNFTAIGRNQNTYLKQEIKEIVAYAQKKYIEVIPIFETLGNQENLLSINQFEYIAEFPGATSLCIACDYTYTYLELVLQEIATTFSSARYLHAGVSNTYDAGFGRSKALAAQLGGLDSLHLYHYQRVYAIASQYEKQLMVFSDMLEYYPSLRNLLPSDVVIFKKLSEGEDPSQSKIDFVQSPLAYILATSAYNQATVFPDEGMSFEEISKNAFFCKENKLMGLLVYNQAQQNHQAFKTLLYPTYTWLGQCAWSSDSTSKEQVMLHSFQNEHPSEASQFYALHQVFSQPPSNVSWNELWRHPLLAANSNYNLSIDSSFFQERKQAIYKTLKASGNIIDELENQLVVQDSAALQSNGLRTQLNLFRLQNNFLYYFYQKLIIQEAIEVYKKTPPPADTRALEASIDSTIFLVEYLKELYQSAWQTLYRDTNLESYFSYFDMLIEDYYIISAQVSEDKLSSPLLQSKWIFDCDTKGEKCKSSATFRTLVYLDTLASRAILQCIANTHAELYVNGQYVDKVYVRNAKNLYLNSEKVKFFNIKNYLFQGSNEIVFRVKNYNQGLQHYGLPTDTTASLNVTGIITLETFERIYVNSNNLWQIKLIQKREEEEINIWKRAFEKPFNAEIIAPDLINEFPSRIQH